MDRRINPNNSNIKLTNITEWLNITENNGNSNNYNVLHNHPFWLSLITVCMILSAIAGSLIGKLKAKMVTGRYKFENLDKIELSPLSSNLEQKSVVPTRRTRSKLPPSPPHIPSDIISKLRTMPSLSNFSRTFREEKQFSHGRNINVPSKLNQNEHYKYRLRKFISEQRIKVESSKTNSENAWFTPFNVEKFLPVVEDSDLDSQNSLKMNEFKTANEHNRMKSRDSILNCSVEFKTAQEFDSLMS